MNAIVYAAKSTEDKHDSIPDQLADCRRLAAARGLEVAGEYQDEDESAYHGDRGPGLAAALVHCEQIRRDTGSAVLIVQHSDRLARGDAKQARHLIEIVLWAIKAGVQLLSDQDPEMLAEGDMQLLMGTIGGMRNNQDSKRKSLSVKAGMKRRAGRGQHNGGPRPYGYRWDATVDERGAVTKRLVVHDAEAAVVRRMYAEFLAGKGQRPIARGLNEDRITAQNGGPWHQGTIARYLANPLYKGAVRLNGEVFEDAEHDAVVSREVWEKVRQLREASARSPGGGRGRYSTGVHLFTKGLLRCGRCGEAMIPVTKPTHTPGRLYEAYSCYRRVRHGPEACSQTPVQRQVIDTAVWGFFARVALDVEATKAAITDAHDAKIAGLGHLRSQTQRDVNRALESLARVRRDYLAGALDVGDWREFRDELQDALDGLKAQLAQLDQQREALTAEMARLDVESVVLRELAGIRSMIAGEAQSRSRDGVEAFRAALRRLFDRFELVAWPGVGAPASGADAVVWQGSEPPTVERNGQVLVLMPYVRPDAIDWHSDEPAFPALKRAALTLSANNSNPLAR
jgi:DNA invertase Pin-like site-specific DNA recombinase/cell division protein FtsB